MSAPPWTRAPTGTSVGTCHFSSRRRTKSTWISATRGGHTAASDARLLRRRRLQGPARHHRAQPAHTPRRHDAPNHETHKSHDSLVGHEPALLRARGRGVGHIAALSCNRGSRRSSPFGHALSGPHLLPAQPRHTGTSTSLASMAMPRPTPVLQ